MKSFIFQALILQFTLLISSTHASFNPTSKSNMVLYWGQASAGSQERLSNYCTDDVSIVVLSFMSSFPGTNNIPTLNFANACHEQYPNGLLKCDTIAADIKTCQAKGIKVLLSMGGAAGSYGFTDNASAEKFAGSLWNLFGEGTSETRPFGDAVLDGFDFDIENNNNVGYAALATKLREYFATGSKKYYLAAAPQCFYPDASVGNLLENSYIDFAFVQFYNNYCSINGQFNWKTWKDFAINTSPNKDIKLYLGLPGAPSGAASGYVGLEQIKTTVESIYTDDQFAGVMLWDASQGFTNKVNGITFVSAIKNVLNAVAGGETTGTTSVKPSTSSILTSTIAVAPTTASTSTSSSTSSTSSSTSSTSSSTSSTSTSTSTSSTSPAFVTSTITSTTDLSTNKETSSTSSSASTRTVTSTTTLTPSTSTSSSSSLGSTLSISTTLESIIVTSSTELTTTYQTTSFNQFNGTPSVVIISTTVKSVITGTIFVIVGANGERYTTTSQADSETVAVTTSVVETPVQGTTTSIEEEHTFVVTNTAVVWVDSQGNETNAPSVESLSTNEESANIVIATSSSIPQLKTTITLSPHTTTNEEGTTADVITASNSPTTPTIPSSVSIATATKTSVSGCDNITDAVSKTACLNAQYQAGQYAGSPDHCTDGYISCSASGAFAICDHGSWVEIACGAGTTCAAFTWGDSVQIGCNFITESTQIKRSVDFAAAGHVHHAHGQRD